MLDSTGLQFTMGVGELPDDTFRVYEFDIAEALSEVMGKLIDTPVSC